MPGFIILIVLFAFVLMNSGGLRAQESPSVPADSLIELSAVTVEGYISGQSLLQTPTSVGIVDGAKLRLQADETLLPALNAVPGVRMEERSPGSYRLSIRGSLLRSPWGVRNVKVYLDEFPLTDAGGNTYLNLIDPRGLGRMEVLKGPHGSLFGANSGGVLLMNTTKTIAPASPRSGLKSEAGPGDGNFVEDGRGRKNLIEAGLSGGSYGMIHENLSFRQQLKKSRFDFNQAFLRSDGYREHSGMRRHYLQVAHYWNYRPASQLKVLAFYADLDYDTPGGLNREQYELDPRQARPPAGPNPGAVEQQAGIRNRTFFGGLSHQFQLARGLRHVAAVFGSQTDFENPFITNYEVRDEDNYGLRTYLELVGSGMYGSSPGSSPGSGSGSGTSVFNQRDFNWKWYLGLEWQRSSHHISNFDNPGNATKGDLQAADVIRSRQSFFFTRVSADLKGRLRAEAAVSLNYNRYAFDDLNEGASSGVPQQTGSAERKFSPEWMPRLSLSYLLTPRFSWRASFSRGYSPPTTAEIRPSNMAINTALNPETGWNYESGFRFMPRDGRLQADVSVFYYRMDQAIVRRLEEGGDEFFVNAGGTNQLGAESVLSAWIIDRRNHGLLRGLQMSSSYTYSHFRFREYRQDTDDYSGNQLTGVPQHVAVSSVLLSLPKAFGLSVRHNFTSRIPLNDANNVYAGGYHLLQLKLRWQGNPGEQLLELYAGADNLLNQKYSLGNDINAFGSRFYNAAPLRNFYGGMRLVF